MTWTGLWDTWFYSGNVFARARYRNKGQILFDLDENNIKNPVQKVMELQKIAQVMGCSTSVAESV